MRQLRFAAAVVLFAAATLSSTVDARESARSVATVSIAPGTPAVREAEQWDELASRTPVVRVGQDYTLRAGEDVREIRAVLGDVTIEGHVQRDTLVILGNVHVKASAVVEGTLAVFGGSATVEPGARVARELVVIGGSLDAPPGFSPGGDFIAVGTPALGDALKAFVPWLTRGLLWARPIVPDLPWVWAIFGVLLLVYVVVNFMFDGPVRASTEAILERPLSVFLLGLLVVILTVPALTILAATVIGLAIVPFVLCAIIVAGLIGKAGVARAIGCSLAGSRLNESKAGSLVAFALGAALLCAAYMVPVLGLVVWAFTSALAVGAASVMLRRRLRREQQGRRRVPAAPATALPETTPPPVFEPLRGQEGPAEAPEAASFGGEPFEGPAAPAGQSAYAAADSPAPAAVPLRPGIFPSATFLDRVAAFALDCLLVALAVQLLDLSRYEGAFPLLLVAYHIAFWTWKGTTLGGVVIGLKVTRLQAQDLRFADALVRGLSGIFSIGAFGIGCFWMLNDPARQMWHDKIAGTQVLKVPREVVLQEN